MSWLLLNIYAVSEVDILQNFIVTLYQFIISSIPSPSHTTPSPSPPAPLPLTAPSSSAPTKPAVPPASDVGLPYN
jgi:hypothetical protein